MVIKMNICVAGLLAVNAAEDVRIQRIILFPTAACALEGALMHTGSGRPVFDLLLRLVPGALFLALAVLVPEKLGTGDGLALLAAGIQLPFFETIRMTAAAVLFASAAAAVLRISGRKNTELPFMPFLLAGYVMITAIKV